MSVKLAWVKRLYDAYVNVKKGDNVYDSSGNLLGIADGCYARPTANHPGSVCLIKNGKYVWIGGDLQKLDGKWKVDLCTNIYPNDR